MYVNNELQTDEYTLDPTLNMILPRLVIFIGGMATKVANHLLVKMKQVFSSPIGPLRFIIIDSAKEIDPAILNSLKARFMYLRPLSLNRLKILTPTPAMVTEHIENHNVPMIEGTPGSGAEPSAGCCYAVVHMPTIDSLIAKMISDVTHPQTIAQAAEDVRLRGRKVDPTRVHVDIVAGHGGTSALSPFVIAECIRDWLRNQNQSFHLCGRFLLASGHASLPKGIQPILNRNMAIQISYLDAVQSRSCLVKREVATVTGNRIRGDEGTLFEETILYGQRSGECLSTDEYTREVANAYFYELISKGGVYLVSRELDFRNTKATSKLNGKCTHHSAIGCTEISAIPTDTSERLKSIISNKILGAMLNNNNKPTESVSLYKKLTSSMDSKLAEFKGLASLSFDQPPITIGMQLKSIRASQGRFQSQLIKSKKRNEASIKKAIEGSSGKKLIHSYVKASLDSMPLASQIQLYEELIAFCNTKASKYANKADQMKTRFSEAQQQCDKLIGHPAQTDEWVDAIRAVWSSLMKTSAEPIFRQCAAVLNDLAKLFQSEKEHLDSMRIILESNDNSVSQSNTKQSSILSSADLLRIGHKQISEAAKVFCKKITHCNEFKCPEDYVDNLLYKIVAQVEGKLLRRYNSIGEALILSSKLGVSIFDRLQQEIETTQPMLTSDSALITGSPLHETSVVIVPEGTIAQLASNNIDLTSLKDAVVIEDIVRDLIILRAFRGFATSVIPELKKGIEHLFRAYENNPEACPPWPHALDAVPLPILPGLDEIQAAILFARILGVNGKEKMPAIVMDGGITYFTAEGLGRVTIGDKNADLLEGFKEAIERKQIDSASIHQEIDRYYEQNPNLDERSILVYVAQVKLNQARGADYVTAMKIQTAIDWFMRVKSDRLQRRRIALATNNPENI